MSNFMAVFGKNAGFHGLFVVTCTKAYLHYLVSLTVILLLIAMLTAGPDRLYLLSSTRNPTSCLQFCQMFTNLKNYFHWQTQQ